MTKELFTSKLKERLEELTGYQVYIQTNSKNNGVKLESLNIMREGTNIYPSIYIDTWWDVYNAGESFDGIVTRVLEWERKMSLNRELDFGFFLDFNKVKENLRFKIINTERNSNLLNSVPHKDIMDLSKVYYVEVYTPEIGAGMILVSNAHMKAWGVTWEELDRIATEQTEQHNEFQILDMADMMNNLQKEKVVTELPEGIEFPHNHLYVFTNRQKFLGASVLLYKDIFKDFAKKINDSLLIILSSVHELIVVPADVVKEKGIKYYRGIVKDVNATQLEPEDFLSDNVYFYNKGTGRLKIV